MLRNVIGSNFFYTVTLPCTLWFFDNHKTNHARKDQIVPNFSLRISHEELRSLDPAERLALLNKKFIFSNEMYWFYDLDQPHFILDDNGEQIATMSFKEHNELVEDVLDFVKIKINRLVKSYREEIENG